MAKVISLFDTQKTKTVKQTAEKTNKEISEQIVKSKDSDSCNNHKRVPKSPKQIPVSTSSENQKPCKKRGRPPKNNLLINTDKQIGTKNDTAVHKQPDTKSVNSCWTSTSKKLPDILRPIEFNTSYKKPVYGYRLKGYGYIVTNPYYINKFKQKFGYMEWRYIPYCLSLSRCPNGIPDCSNCKYTKNKV